MASGEGALAAGVDRASGQAGTWTQHINLRWISMPGMRFPLSVSMEVRIDG